MSRHRLTRPRGFLARLNHRSVVLQGSDILKLSGITFAAGALLGLLIAQL